ncbi:MAG TPA: hypothetical protein VMF67_08905 [Rhizomicrobium sp.]|nr:hypothetical protein [Rhizomicrobium sp.]
MTRSIRNGIYTMARLGTIAAISASRLSPVPAGADGIAGNGLVEHASADDCAIIAEIGKTELHWSATQPPKAAFYPTYATPGGGTYLEDCPWKNLGVAPPQTPTSGAPMGFFVTRPVYSNAGARAWFQYSVTAVTGADGKKIPPFVERDLCLLEKDADGWHVTRCKLTSIR